MWIYVKLSRTEPHNLIELKSLFWIVSAKRPTYAQRRVELVLGGKIVYVSDPFELNLQRHSHFNSKYRFVWEG